MKGGRKACSCSSRHVAARRWRTNTTITRTSGVNKVVRTALSTGRSHVTTESVTIRVGRSITLSGTACMGQVNFEANTESRGKTLMSEQTRTTKRKAGYGPMLIMTPTTSLTCRYSRCRTLCHLTLYHTF